MASSRIGHERLPFRPEASNRLVQQSDLCLQPKKEKTSYYDVCDVDMKLHDTHVSYGHRTARIFSFRGKM
jgi:hypothetical protein